MNYINSSYLYMKVFNYCSVNEDLYALIKKLLTFIFYNY